MKKSDRQLKTLQGSQETQPSAVVEEAIHNTIEGAMLDSVGLSIFNDDQGQAMSFVVTAARQTPKQKSTSQEAAAPKLVP